MKYSEDQKYSVMKNKKKKKKERKNCSEDQMGSVMKNTPKKKKWKRKKKKQKRGEWSQKVAAGGSLSVCLIMKMLLEI